MGGIRDEKGEIIKGLYVNTGFGSKGYVFAPYTSDILVKNILGNEPIDPRYDTLRLFNRYQRKTKQK